jgi:fatty acid desaturase
MSDANELNASYAPSATLPADALTPLMDRRDVPALAQLAGHLVLLLSTGLFVAALKGTIWVLPAMCTHGVVLVFLFAPLHECIHRTAFRTRALNDAVGFLAGLLLLLPREYFRAFHFAHHRDTQNPAKDPELAAPKPATLGQWLLVVSGLRYWWSQMRSIARHARGDVDEPFLADPRVAARIVREARLALGIYAVLAAASVGAMNASLFWFWIGPAILGQPFLRLFLLAEHTLCPLVPDMLKNSRTTISNTLVRHLAWNMPYHAEHHAYPGVPFHMLPQLHELLSPHLGCVADGYFAANRDILGALGK